MAVLHSEPSSIALEPGVPVNRKIARGQIHRYRLVLGNRQFARIAVDQREIDVSISVAKPDGSQILRFNGVSWGEESVCVVAAVAGSYQVSVSAEKDGTAAGSYQVSVTEIRPSTGQDRKRLAAQNAFVAGFRERARGTAASQPRALVYFREAASQWHAVGDRRNEARALQETGLMLSRTGQFDKAIETYQKAIRLWDELKDPLAKLETLDRLAPMYGELGQEVKLMPPLSEVRELWKAAGERRREAVALDDMGIACRRSGQYERSFEYHKQAMELWGALGDLKGQAKAVEHIGETHLATRSYDRALEFFLRWLDLAKALRDRRGEAAANSKVGSILLELA